jgi:hypothetical protein
MALKFLSGYISKILNQGWRNNVDWPTDPVDEAAARERLQIQHDQTRDYINDYLNYLDDTGAADAYVVTLDPAPDSYPRMIQFKAAHANTGASTIKPNALDAVAIKKNVSSDLAAGDIPEGGIACLVYDGTYYQLVNPAVAKALADHMADLTAHSTDKQFLSRQAFINGNFDIWQRGITFAATGSRVYAADRWCTYNNIASQACTISKQDGSGVQGALNCLRYQRNNGQTGTNVMYLVQSLESQDSKKFIGKKLTLSFWARIGNGASVNQLLAEIISGTGTDENAISGFTGFSAEVQQIVTLTTGWQKFTITSAAALAVGKTQVGLIFAYTPVGAAGANDYFEIAQVQLGAGDVALPFSPKSFDEELKACMRYYFKTFPYGTAPAQNAGVAGAFSIVSNAAAAFGGSFILPVKMRVTPNTLTTYNPSAANANWRDVTNNTDKVVTVTNDNEGSVLITGAAGVVGAINRIHFTADAEL